LARVRRITVAVPEKVARQVERLVEVLRGTTIEAYLENQLGEMASRARAVAAEGDETDEVEPRGMPQRGYA
jgi:hypothetical protein